MEIAKGGEETRGSRATRKGSVSGRELQLTEITWCPRGQGCEQKQNAREGRRRQTDEQPVRQVDKRAGGGEHRGRVVGEAGLSARARGRSIKRENGVALEPQEGKGRN